MKYLFDTKFLFEINGNSISTYLVNVQHKCILFITYCTNVYCVSLWYNSTVTAISFDDLISSASKLFVCLNDMYFGESSRI